MSFEQLLDSLRDGDREAVAELLNRWRPYLRNRARGLMGARMASRADSSDLVQEVLVEANNGIDTFQGHCEGQWRAWLQTILRRQATKLTRYHTAECRAVKTENAAYEPLAASQNTPSEVMSAKEDWRELLSAIELLPPAMRTVVSARVFERKSFEAIAEEMQTTSGAARVTWTRAVRKLTDALNTGSSTSDSSVPDSSNASTHASVDGSIS
ncbi:sigma-70 family RNA polymerase sigma factor [bacterium]|nr:sigma-70 family RNA polymerase sigma factor [bacterium]